MLYSHLGISLRGYSYSSATPELLCRELPPPHGPLSILLKRLPRCLSSFDTLPATSKSLSHLFPSSVLHTCFRPIDFEPFTDTTKITCSSYTMSYNGKGGQNPQRGHGRGTGSSGGRGSGDSGHSYRGTPAGGSGCFNCGGSGHICRDCPNSGGGGSAFRGGRGGRGGGLGGGQRGGRGGFHDEIKGPINNPRPIDIPSFPILFQSVPVLRILTSANIPYRPEKTVQLPSADVEKLETALVTRTMQSKFAELSLEGDVKLPRRPGYGKTGKPIELRTNYFEMKPKEDVQFYRWQIKIHEAESKKAWDTPAPGSEPTPGDKPTPKQKIRRVIELFLQSPYLAKFRPRVASDYQAMLITTEKLDFKGQEFGEYALVYSGEELLDPASDRGLRLTISVRADGVIGVRQLLKYLTSTNIQERCDDKANLLQVLNIIMAQKPSNDPSIASFTRSNKFFPLSAYLGDLGGGIGAFRGYYSSARTATGRLLLNVNSVTSAFYHDVSLNDLIRAYMQGDQEGRRINGFLKGLRVKVSHLPKDKKRPRKIRTVSAVSYQQGSEPPVFDNPMTVKFEKGGKFITVKEHFAKGELHTIHSYRHYADSNRTQYHSPSAQRICCEPWECGPQILGPCGAV